MLEQGKAVQICNSRTLGSQAEGSPQVRGKPRQNSECQASNGGPTKTFPQKQNKNKPMNSPLLRGLCIISCIWFLPGVPALTSSLNKTTLPPYKTGVQTQENLSKVALSTMAYITPSSHLVG